MPDYIRDPEMGEWVEAEELERRKRHEELKKLIKAVEQYARALKDSEDTETKPRLAQAVQLLQDINTKLDKILQALNIR